MSNIGPVVGVIVDFEWTDQQLAFRKEVVQFAETELRDDVSERDAVSSFSRRLWERCAEFGIQGMAVPRHYGGKERADILSAMLAMEGMGRACPDLGLLLGLNAQMWTVQLPIMHFGSEEQKKRWLPPMCSGECIGAHAMTEPTAGSDVFSMETTAEKCDGGYRLNGSKHFVTLAPEAQVALIFASVNREIGKWGITAFLVDLSSAGVEVSDSGSKMGLRTVPMGTVRLQDSFVPQANRLGAEGTGFAISQHSLEFERCCILASQIGVMERQLETSVEYAKTRTQFGQPIGRFQAVSHRIAEMKMRLETARLLLYKVAWLKQRGAPAMMDAAILKLYLSESFVDSSLDAIRNHGGHGYLTGSGVERDLRDAIGGVLYAGTSDIQRNIIASLLGL